MVLKTNHVIGEQDSVIVTGEWWGEAVIVADTIAIVSVIASNAGVELIGPLMMEDVIRLISTHHITVLYKLCLVGHWTMSLSPWLHWHEMW